MFSLETAERHDLESIHQSGLPARFPCIYDDLFGFAIGQMMELDEDDAAVRCQGCVAGSRRVPDVTADREASRFVAEAALEYQEFLPAVMNMFGKSGPRCKTHEAGGTGPIPAGTFDQLALHGRFGRGHPGKGGRVDDGPLKKVGMSGGKRVFAHTQNLPVVTWFKPRQRLGALQHGRRVHFIVRILSFCDLSLGFLNPDLLHDSAEERGLRLGVARYERRDIALAFHHGDECVGEGALDAVLGGGLAQV